MNDLVLSVFSTISCEVVFQWVSIPVGHSDKAFKDQAVLQAHPKSHLFWTLCGNPILFHQPTCQNFVHALISCMYNIPSCVSHSTGEKSFIKFPVLVILFEYRGLCFSLSYSSYMIFCISLSYPFVSGKETVWNLLSSIGCDYPAAWAISTVSIASSGEGVLIRTCIYACMLNYI